MPLSTSPCEGRCDANVATAAGQGAAGARPACEVRGPEVLNVCELREQGPFVLAFVFHPVERCRDQLPVLERVAARHRDVQFRVVAVRANASDARGLRSVCPSATTTTAPSPTSTPSSSARRSPTSSAAARSPGRRSACRAKRSSTSGCGSLSELALVCETVEVSARRSPPDVRARLRALADRVPRVPHDVGPLRDRDGSARHRGAGAGGGRAAGAARSRGGYRSRGLLRDALLIAVVETGVGVWADGRRG